MRRFPFLIAAPILASLVVTAPAAAHEKGVLRPGTRELAAGDSLSISGEHFTKSATLKLLLVGPRGRTPLGDVRTDSAGSFTGRVAVPAATAPGAYRLVAVATDGDEVATVDVAVRAVQTADQARTAPTAMEEMVEPSAAPLALDRAHSGPVTAGVVALAAIAAIAGIALIRRQAAGG